jgi:uncharacterized caspase-like protein/tetratricopeptide (TPR) repeat protein
MRQRSFAKMRVKTAFHMFMSFILMSSQGLLAVRAGATDLKGGDILIAQATPSTGQMTAATTDAKITTLRSAVKNGDVKIVLSGDGVTTSHQNLSLTNNRNEALRLVIPANEVFRPNVANIQMMMATKDTIVTLPPQTTVTIDLSTVCVSAKTVKPPGADGTTFEVGQYPNTGVWKNLVAIVNAAQKLNQEGAYDKLFTKKELRRNMIAQLAIWMKLGQDDGRSEDAVTKDGIAEDLLTQLNIDRKQLTPEKQTRFDAGVEAIFLAADATVRRADKLTDGAQIPTDANYATLAQVGERAFSNGEYTDAEQLLGAALTDAKSLGDADPNYQDIMSKLANCYFAQGKNEKAEVLLTVTLLPLREKQFGADSAEVGNTLRQLGMVYRQEKKNDLSTKAFERAVAIQAKAAPDSADLALTLNSLGELYMSQGDKSGADKSFRKALDIRSKLGQTFSAETAEIKKNLGNLLAQEGKPKEAETLYQEALACDATVLGNEHAYIAVLLDGLANVYKAEHRGKDAEELTARATAIKQKCFAANPTLLASLPSDYESVARAANFASGVDLVEPTVKETKSNSALALAEKQEIKTRLNRKVKDKWALVVGISNFADSSINLKYSSKDARDFCNYLIQDGNFKPDHIHLLLNEKATRENILSQLGDRWLPRVAGPDDLVVIFISTHGSPSRADVAGVNYLVAYNTDKNSLLATGIPLQDLANMVRDRVHCDRCVIIMDACHSGAAVDASGAKGLFRVNNVSADEVFQGTGQLVICSSQPSQVSWESKRYNNGVFTHYLLEGLRKNGNTTKIAEAATYMRDRVQDEVLKDRGELQTPVMRSKWEGNDLIVAVPPTEVRSGTPDDGSTTRIEAANASAAAGEINTPIQAASKSTSTAVKTTVKTVGTSKTSRTAVKK